MTKFTINTRGHYDFINITKSIEQVISSVNIKEGLATIFVTGTTAALLIMEDEPGIAIDIKNILENLAPEKNDYHHHRRWGDANGAAHIKSALLGPDLNIPIIDARLALGTWQQIFLVDFDEKPRQREILVNICQSV